jgi:hypothetical protein
MGLDDGAVVGAYSFANVCTISWTNKGTDALTTWRDASPNNSTFCSADQGEDRITDCGADVGTLVAPNLSPDG